MPLQFDIRAILRSKAPKAHVPDFLVRYLERIAHVKQMNAFLRKHQTERNYDFIRLVLDEELCCSASIDGTENIPSDGKPVIFVSNHPLGGLDGMIIAQMIHESRSEKNDIIELALKELGAADRSCVLMVGDRDNDVLGARLAGIDCCGVLYGYGSREELEGAGAKYIIQKPEDLLTIV